MKLAKIYDPNQYEPNVYAMWEKSNAFASKGKGEPYCIVMPPPNANGNLHIGHALGGSVQDILVRYWRMRGKDAVYIPGADHAGFETWVVYERTLTEKGIDRFSFSREQLYSQVWDFVEQQRGNMELQLRALGSGCSWNDLVFTLDNKVIDTVYDTFKKMWDDGLIYRGERIVNYSTKYQTSYADIEVNHKLEKGKLWDIAYPLYDKIGEIVVSTTRPETMFGDTAIAVHPDDKRYKDLVGTRVMLPLTDRVIPIIADELIDPEFGTGAVKVTPAHDPNDFEIGQRHNLDRIQVIDFNGTMINVPDKLVGMTVEDAREMTLTLLRNDELLRGEKEIEHTVGYDYKSGLPIQPLIKEQWFIKVKPLAERAKQAVIDGQIKFIPESKKNNLIRYYEQLRDWNISRQIPWGIPIPAFQNIDDPNDWIFDRRVDEKVLNIDGKTYKREEDTFDTWFSSGQWPFITTDYLTDGPLSKHYPIDVMETGADILSAWVSRMIMIGLYRTGQVPFKTVYLHGLVLDEKGQKMSKSKGNVINPMDAISKYGSDALRMGLIASRSAGQNQAFSLDRVIAGRNFCNKLWNIARFIEDKVGDGFRDKIPEPVTMADHWIIKQLDEAIDSIASQIETYRFAEAGETIYHSIWDDVADWYIEASKHSTNKSMLNWVLNTSLKIAHPFAPFVTETIWQTLAWHDSLLVNASWPEKIAYDEIAAAEFSRLKTLVTEIRFVLTELPGNERYDLLYFKDALIEDNAKIIQTMAKLKGVQSTDNARGLRLTVTGREAWLDIPPKTLAEHQSNLEMRLAEVHKDIQMLETRLGNRHYVEKAPKRLVEESQNELKNKQALAERLVKELEILT
ncbi:valine--tRNA ligase [Candidatus Saccharibacteria bacterium]|nr:valine--tRNA ligase [Candidatus Saccharibacteria bacterium]